MPNQIAFYPQSSGGGAVSSVFGRTGSVVATTGDYTAAQVTNAAATNTANTFSSLQTFSGGLTTPGVLTMTNFGSCSIGQNSSGYSVFSDNSGIFVALNGGASSVTVQNGSVLGWAASSSNGPNTAFSRLGAGIVGLGNGNVGDTSGSILAAFHTTGVGTQITAAATIAPTNSIHHVTGATPIATVTIPAGVTAGWTLSLIPDSAFTTVATGNIALASTAVVGRTLTLTWDGTKLYPSY